MKNVIPALAALVFFGCAGDQKKEQDTTAEKAAQLVFRPDAGVSYTMVYELEVQNKTSGDRTNFMIDLVTEVKEADSEKIILLTHYKAITMNGHISGKDVQLDAATHVKDQSDASVVAAPVFAYLGKDFETTYDKEHYKIDEKQVRSANDSTVVAAESKVQFVGHYPTKKFKTGDTWKSEGPTKIGSNEVKDMQYTVTRISEAEVELSLSGIINTTGEKFGQEYKINGHVSGNMVVDRKSGWQKKTTLDIGFDLEMGDKKTPMLQKISFYLK